MNRLLLLAFLLAMMAVATLGSREEEEDSIARSAREADPGKRRKGGSKSIRRCKIKCKGNSQCKKRCDEQKKKNSNGKKKTSSRRRSGMRRRPKTSKNSNCGRASSCEDTVAKLLKMLYNKVPNYIRQSKRILAANKTGGKKNGKVAIFAKTAQRIVQAGGGNMSALTCMGATNSTGAAKLTSMATDLKACAKNIDMACNPMNLPLPNMTEMTACVETMEAFKMKMNVCVNMTADCTCYEATEITNLQTTIKTCSLADDNRMMIEMLQDCKKNFTACKTMEDDGMKATHACSISTASMTADAAALTANSAGLAEAQKTTAGLASNTSGSGRQKRAAVTTCAGVIDANTKILAAVEMMPTDPMIATLCATITNISVTCTAAEITSLTAQATKLTAAKDSVDSALATVQDLLETATGSTASSAAIAAAGGATTMSATMASGGRRNIVARHLLNRLNLK